MDLHPPTKQHTHRKRPAEEQLHPEEEQEGEEGVAEEDEWGDCGTGGGGGGGEKENGTGV